MKIFGNFNTHEYREKFESFLQKYGENNILMFKRHVVYILLSLFSYGIALSGFVLMFFVFRVEFENYPTFFTLYTWANGIIFWLWSLLYFYGIVRSLLGPSPIATNVTEIWRLKNRFQLFIKLYLIIFVLIVFLVVSSLMLEFYFSDSKSLFNLSLVSVHVFACIIYIIGAYGVTKRVIKYEMDYFLVSPDYLEFHEQRWFFTNTSVTVDTARVSMISVKSSGIIQSILSYGTLWVLTDNNNLNNQQKITVRYVPRPAAIQTYAQHLIKWGE